ncbi:MULTISPECIES: YihY/virulence factor BrkB family protein [Streptomycetaceae]|uniref:YihY/virulence factor BrkB family protein n=1 Tax=Streptomycetaceae TaxID=2062 RepID=UPI000213FCD1|nr:MULTISPECIES: YihY/virulence factor BrkB family protein [Streptomycetaceae]MYS60644.1 YihY/virulence factor BrkB family protein [Streptomyces sp. SID5468]CCB76452.1 Integral membrane protein [Streptantibioticus cattleyicolor NRRL 8057 = DSM 46488]
MDWLTRLPGVGPWVGRGMRTHAWRAFEHAQRAQWGRLAAAITFSSFIALFPLITLGAAIGAAVLTDGQLHTLEHKLNQQIPGLSQQVDIAGLAANAGTVGLIAAAALLLTGVGWIGQLRGCLRAVWERDDEGQNPLVRKGLDALILVGLGLVGAASLGGSAYATSAVGRSAQYAGVSGAGVGGVLLTAVGFLLGVLADFLLLAYLLTWLPGVHPGRHQVVVAGLLGAVGFELLKLLLSGYLQGVAGRSLYGAFGTPVALLLWINFMAKLLLYCAAWTATPRRRALLPDPPPGSERLPTTPADPGDAPLPGPATASVPPLPARPAPPAPPR